jgi:hypothetical protein
MTTGRINQIAISTREKEAAALATTSFSQQKLLQPGPCSSCEARALKPANGVIFIRRKIDN